MKNQQNRKNVKQQQQTLYCYTDAELKRYFHICIVCVENSCFKTNAAVSYMTLI